MGFIAVLCDIFFGIFVTISMALFIIGLLFIIFGESFLPFILSIIEFFTIGKYCETGNGLYLLLCFGWIVAFILLEFLVCFIEDKLFELSLYRDKNNK